MRDIFGYWESDVAVAKHNYKKKGVALLFLSIRIFFISVVYGIGVLRVSRFESSHEEVPPLVDGADSLIKGFCGDGLW